jgi:hypothetical protein
MAEWSKRLCCPECGKGNSGDAIACTACGRSLSGPTITPVKIVSLCVQKSFFCKIGIHSWGGCTCLKCGTTRNRDHHWDGCMCAQCGQTRSSNHRWNGCICTLCGKWRDKEHLWDACKCAVCGQTRKSDHRWDDCCTCEVCGLSAHKNALVICEACGTPMDITTISGNVGAILFDVFGFARLATVYIGDNFDFASIARRAGVTKAQPPFYQLWLARKGIISVLSASQIKTVIEKAPHLNCLSRVTHIFQESDEWRRIERTGQPIWFMPSERGYYGLCHFLASALGGNESIESVTMPADWLQRIKEAMDEYK